MFHGNGLKKKKKVVLMKEMPHHLFVGFQSQKGQNNIGKIIILAWWFSGSWLTLLGIHCIKLFFFM